MSIKCDICGKFVSADTASRKLVSDDTHYSTEDYETVCHTCSDAIKSFDEACEDIRAGRVVDLDTAINEPFVEENKNTKRK